MDVGRREQVSQEKYIRGIAISTAVFCLPALIQDLGFLHAFVPLPVFYYLTCFGQKNATSLLSIAILCAALISAVSGALSTLLFSLTLVPLGFIFSKAASRKETVNQAGLKGIVYLVVAWIVLGWGLAVIHQSNPYTDMLKSIDQGFEATFSQLKETAELPDSTLGEIETAFKQWQQFIAKMFPALILTSILFTVWLNLALGNWLLKKKAPSSAPWHDFRDWRIPDPLVWIVAVAILCMLLPIEFLKIAGINSVFVMGVLYFFQGLAVLASMFVKWSVPTIFRVFIYALTIIYGIIPLAFVGIADVWGDFGKIRRAE